MKINAVVFAFIVCVSVFALFLLPNGGVAHADNVVDPDAVAVLESSCEYARAHGFTSSTYGEITARVFGIKYVQRVYGQRVVKDGDYSEHAESVSTFVKAALKKSYAGGKYYVAHGSIKRGNAVYPELSEISESDYLASYGAPPLGLIKYVLDGTVVSARKTGENEYTYALDPQKSTVNCAVGVRSAIGSDSLPEYGSVEVVLYTDGVKPVRTLCRERMRVDKFGGTECSAVYEEKFEF